MARVPAILAALASTSETVTGFKSQYPMKASAPTDLLLVINASDLEISRTGNEQRWKFMARGWLLIPNKGDMDKHFARADASLAPIADAFDAKDGVEHYQLGGLVNRCQFVRAELYQAITYAGMAHVGHVLYWDIDARRFKGDA